MTPGGLGQLRRIIGQVGRRVGERADEQLAYLGPAKALAAMVVDMLGDGAAGAREVLTTATPRMTREAYLAFQRGVACREVFDGSA